MPIHLNTLIDPPTSWQRLLSAIEGMAEREGWETQKEQAYGAVLAEATRWEELRGAVMELHAIEVMATESGKRLLQACGDHQKLMDTVGSHLLWDGHALSFLGWAYARGGRQPFAQIEAIDRALTPKGERFASALLAWGTLPSEFPTDGKIPWVGGQPRQSYINPISGSAHPLVIALGAGATESATRIWESEISLTQEILDQSLLAIMAHVHRERPTEKTISWIKDLLEAGANPNATHPINLVGQAMVYGPANGAKFPTLIRPLIEERKEWGEATPYSYGPIKRFNRNSADLSANDLAMITLFEAPEALMAQWHDLWLDQWKTQKPSLALPWHGNNLDAFIGRLLHVHERRGNNLSDDTRKVARERFLTLLSETEQWWNDPPSDDLPWRAWDMVVYTMNHKAPGTGIPAPAIGTTFLEALLDTLPNGVYLSGRHAQQVAEAIIENISLRPIRQVSIKDGQTSDTGHVIHTEHEVLERALDLVIAKTEPEVQTVLISQKANLIEELKLAGHELVDEMTDRQKVGQDIEDLQEKAGARTRRLLLLTQTMTAPTRRTGPSMKM